VSHLFFVHNLWPDTLTTINPPSWSLANEMQFYLLAMLAAPWLVRLPPLVIAVGLWLFALLWRVLAWRISHAQGVDAAGTLNWLSTLAPGMLDSFGLGLALAAARRRGIAAPRGAMRWLTSGLALVALGALAGVTEAVARGTLWQTPVVALGLHSWAALAAAALVWAVHDLQPSAPMRSAWIWAGQLSYGVYLWHAIVLFLLIGHTSLRGPALLAATLGPTLVLAALGWILLERPVLRRAGAGAGSTGGSGISRSAATK
jgi:peptidoglycan/LPS O-acetylase OafA/YrhL